MSDFSQQLIGRSGYEGEGFAELYDGSRPRPPAVVREVLIRCAGGGRPSLVVDLGSGTGLSTRLWAGHADGVVGVEANQAMIERARGCSPAEIEYVQRFADDTGLDAGAADIVTCAQSFHWMDPTAVLPEAARVLRPGGVFAAYDYDVVPVVEPAVDAAFAAVIASRSAARKRLNLEAGAARWPKHGHADRMRESGLFAHVREVHCHGEGSLDATSMVALARSIGGPVEIFGDRAPEVGESMAELVRLANERLPVARPSLTGYTIRLGITPAA
jgi:ubiquinone/menaquinone biosynthesis C-methylase UbiE